MAIGIRPPNDAGESSSTKRHPRLVHDEMEAIFGAPNGVGSRRRGFSPGIATHVAPPPQPRLRLTSVPMWIGLALLFCLMSLGAFYIARKTSEDPYAQTAAAEPALPDLGPAPAAPAAPAPAPVDKAPVIATKPAVPVLTTPPAPPAPAPVATPVASRETAKTAVPPAAANGVPGAANPPAAPAEVHNGCDGTSYERMATCPSPAVRKADRELSAAYSNAIAANVDPAKLSYYSQRWSQLRESAAASPEPTVEEFNNMASQLNALVVAQISRKP